MMKILYFQSVKKHAYIIVSKMFVLLLFLWVGYTASAQPSDFNYYKSLGLVQYYEKDYLQSIFNLQKASTIKPNDKEIANYLRMCYDSVGNKDLSGKMRLKMEKFGSTPEPRPVIKPAMLSDSPAAGTANDRSPIRRPIITAKSDIAHDLRQLGDYFMDRASYDSAVICYQHYTDVYPSDTATRFYLATAQYFTKRYDDAVNNYQIVLRKEPKRAELYNWIGVCELLRGNYLAARDNFKQCIKLDIDYSLAYFNLGKTQYELEDYGDAATNLEKAQEYMPDDADILKMLSEIYYNTGNWDKSQAAYEKLYATNKKSERVNYRLGELNERTGHWDNAITYFSNFLEIAPANIEARKKIGIAYYNTEKYASAVENFDKAAKTLWDDKELMLDAAISANKLNDYQKAIDYANRVLTLDKNSVKAYYQLGTAYKGLGQNKQSKEAMAKAKDLEMNAVNLN